MLGREKRLQKRENRIKGLAEREEARQKRVPDEGRKELLDLFLKE